MPREGNTVLKSLEIRIVIMNWVLKESNVLFLFFKLFVSSAVHDLDLQQSIQWITLKCSKKCEINVSEALES